ncbi:hypothetical protein [Salibacterium qingdaonense]|uniref:Uncharacterized protein n=1 Tax=Salibacterium qingdaonense TaxID=266892 RepID=A0A1I4NKJ5_9BACI|nr:hypothetical protein [Salibacterium qingdaonense]SFM15827.1 hypothetical protein SAMN04488054_11860 [Salibacterium qingdaonense]
MQKIMPVVVIGLLGFAAFQIIQYIIENFMGVLSVVTGLLFFGLLYGVSVCNNVEKTYQVKLITKNQYKWMLSTGVTCFFLANNVGINETLSLIPVLIVMISVLLKASIDWNKWKESQVSYSM